MTEVVDFLGSVEGGGLLGAGVGGVGRCGGGELVDVEAGFCAGAVVEFASDAGAAVELALDAGAVVELALDAGAVVELALAAGAWS